MGVLFEMENDFVDVKNKVFHVSSGKNPAEFKVALVKRDEPHMPTKEVNGFTPSSASMDMWGHNTEVLMLNYDAVLKIGGVVLRMQMQEFMNLSRILEQKTSNFYRAIASSNTMDEVQATINTIRSRT